MTKQRVLNLVSISLNVINVILVTVAVIFNVGGFVTDSVFGESGVTAFLFFTILSNTYLALTALIMIPYQLILAIKKENKIPVWLLVLHYTAVVSVMLTCLVTFFFLMPSAANSGNDPLGLIAGVYCLVHLVVPVLAAINFCLLMVEPTLKFKWTPCGILPLVAYAIFYMLNIELKFAPVYGKNGVAYYDWYGMFGDGTDIGRIFLVIIIILVATYVICLVIFLLNMIFRHIFKGYDDDEGEEVVLEEEPAEVVEEKPKQKVVHDEIIVEDKVIGHVGDGNNQEPINKKEVVKGEDGYDEVTETYTTDTGTIHVITKKVKAEPEPNKLKSTTTQIKTVRKTTTSIPATRPNNKYKDGARTYHISKHFTSGKWQVKLANGEKAIKLFDTQLEAINYAKGLVKSQGGSIRVHSLQGRIRKH